MIRMTMCVSFHLRPWKNKYSTYPVWHQGITKLFPYGLLVGQHPPENILPTGWKIKLHITIHKILFSSLEEISRINFSCYYYHYYLSLNQYNLTHYIPFWLMEPLSWMLVHKKFTYSKKFFMPRNSVNPIIYGKAVPSDHIKKNYVFLGCFYFHQ